MKSENQQVSKIEYSLSVGMAKELSMIENNEQAKGHGVISSNVKICSVP